MCIFTHVDLFCGDDSLPTKKDGASSSKDTIHLKWCTPKTTSAPGQSASKFIDLGTVFQGNLGLFLHH